ncbi:MAG: B12-binding domain-containing radical SAM protein, partial [Planctomycetes bacterium]|nr:B12-binding domain-containing radical SAM protein [Planctomycetota bacterium]
MLYHKKTFLDYIHDVQNPMQYLGHEDNVVHKNHQAVDVKFASVFPDTYTVGMSHTGSAIIYNLLNAENDIACERAFLPNQDFIDVLRRYDFPLFALESRKPLSEFDIIGFSVNVELNYTNILHVLELAKIPVLSAQRDDSHPLIIAGGTVSLHCTPLHDFIDAFILGDAENNLV